MKKIIFASAVAAGVLGSVNVQAATTTICTGATVGAAGVVPASGSAGTNFMVTAIAPKCSANVLLVGNDGTNGAWYAVGSTSAKGKNTFKGGTAGGAVAPSAACAVPGGCTAAEATTAVSAVAGS